MSLIESIDEAILNSIDKVGHIYQRISGKSKDVLSLKLYKLSALLGGTASAINYDNGELLAGGCGAAALGFYNALIKQHQMNLTENIPTTNDESNIEKLFASASFIGSVLALSKGVSDIAYSVGSRDYSYIKTGFTELSFGASLLALMTGNYLDRCDIEPPKGKSVIQDFKDKLGDAVTIMKPVYQHYPQGANYCNAQF